VLYNLIICFKTSTAFLYSPESSSSKKRTLSRRARAVPCRYIRGPASILYEEDFYNTIQLVKVFVEEISKTK
ncbi:MAG: hypothetical protein JSV20_03465, partial [Candidatus Bathyarchaeota archaeon]